MDAEIGIPYTRPCPDVRFRAERAALAYANGSMFDAGDVRIAELRPTPSRNVTGASTDTCSLSFKACYRALRFIGEFDIPRHAETLEGTHAQPLKYGSTARLTHRRHRLLRASSPPVCSVRLRPPGHQREDVAAGHQLVAKNQSGYQRKAAVCTGASHKRLASSSSAVTVSDAPAISREVVLLPTRVRATARPSFASLRRAWCCSK